MAALYTNNASTILASGITNSATSLTVQTGNGAKFPNPTSPDYFMCTLQGVSGTPIEIIKVTARSTDTFTIVRAQEGTTASAFNANDIVELRVTAGEMTQINQLGQGNASTMKNRIINGAMVIDQRNAGAVITNPTSAQYLLDRFYYRSTSATPTFTVQQNAGSVTPPVGFSNYMGIAMTNASTPSSADRFSIGQPIEGFNTADLGWGTANAKTITLSFWVYSSLTGTFGGALQNSAQTYSYPFTYTISSANTWQQITLTVVGPTAGTWIGATNGVGIYVFWSLGTGSTLQGTAGSWSANTYWAGTGSTNIVSTSGATFYITGVQLEVGSSATGFEYRQYGQELALCQRYALPVFGSFTGFSNGTTVVDCSMTFPVPMRTAPTAGSSSATVASCVTAGGATSTQSSLSFTFQSTGVVSQFGASVRFSFFSGLTSGQTAYVYTNASTPAGFLTAEL